jgi:hypothetical protein
VSEFWNEVSEKMRTMMNDHPTDEPRGLVDAIVCGTLFLGGPSLLAIVLIVFLLYSGVSSQLIEKGMVWLSVPWFAFCYALCKMAHGTGRKEILAGTPSAVATRSRGAAKDL